jgi:23S rRNA (uridine2552-2'-O)-methyltransferase
MKLSKQQTSTWNDHFAQKAKKEQFPARSVYKLKEIQQKTNLIKKGDHVLDLGCYPGSWLKYASEMTGSNGHIIGVDVKSVSIQLPSNVTVYKKDIYQIQKNFSDFKTGFNVIMSDMAPDTTGNKHADNAQSFHLCMHALSIVEHFLILNGSFLCKIFQGEDFNMFIDLIKNKFQHYKIFKPKSSRKASREIYVIGLGFL